MKTLEDQRVVVTGGSRGLGLGIVEALVARKANVTVVARDPGRLAEVKHRLGVGVAAGDIADPELAERVIREVRPSILILNAGASPAIGPIHTQTWDDFSRVWNTDVQAGLHWIQAALRLPLPRGSRVLLGSSGAAIAGSPLSGGYAGAKRMLWLMAGYANASSEELGLGIKFQVVIPRQIDRRHRARPPRGRGLRPAQGRHAGGVPRRVRRAADRRAGRRARRDPAHRPALRGRRRVRPQGRSGHPLARRVTRHRRGRGAARHRHGVRRGRGRSGTGTSFPAASFTRYLGHSLRHVTWFAHLMKSSGQW